MENIFNRLQFVKHEEVFATREEAVNYVLEIQPIERPALLAEPMVLLYESEDAAKGPNVILAIGSVGDGKTLTNANRTFFIDTQKTEEEIQDLDERLEAAIKSLTLVPITSDTIAMNAEKTAEGTFVSGDVKIADYRIIDGVVVDNIIETEGEKGIYTFVDMDYDPETFIITFKTTKTTKEFQLTPDQHVVRGWYSPKHESIFLELADGSKVEIDVVNLIDEWTVLPDSTTPILLTKTHVDSFDEEHDGVYDWQDILTADVRVADHIGDNIIHKDRTGRYLYVKGTADNIKYSEGVTVKEAIDRIDTRVSTSEGNLIYKRPDGIYAYAMLDYKQAENKLIYTYSDGETEDFKTIEFQLNSVKVLEDITYDPVKEVIVIRYIDAKGEYQRVEIPVKDIIEEWDVLNYNHNIELNKFRSEGQGKDLLTADVKIHNGDNNILEDKDHTLYVNGIAENIKYDATGETTVKNVLDTLKSEDERIEAKLDQEIERSTTEDAKIETTIGTGFSTDAHETITYKFDELQSQVNEEAQKLQDEIDRSTAKDNEHDEEIAAIDADIDKINDTIGSGFSTDAHETITYKFDELQSQVNSEADKLQAEIDRSTSADTVHDGRLDTIETEIGDGFGPRNTIRDEIDAISADVATRLSDISNDDKSINVDKTNPNEPVIKVNISGHESNTIRLIQQEGIEGLFNFVDLTYDADHNTLTFTRSTAGSTDFSREIQLQSVSFIDEIYYDKHTEELVIVYYSGHDRKEMRIPLKDLIDEWDVYNDVHSAVKLTKVWDEGLGKNILSAEVIISDKEDNILENQEGELYVSNSAITANAAAIAAETARAEEAEADLDDKIEDEIARATAKENELEAAINNEVTRATGEEQRIETKLDTEIEDRTADVERIDTTIGSGFTTDPHETITYKFDGLQAQVDSEATKLQNEIDRSTAKDNEHDAEIAEEIARATEAENILTDKVGSGFTTNPYENVTYKFEQLSGKVDSEAAELDAEIARSTAKDNEHDADIETLDEKVGTGFTTDPHDNVTYKFEQLSGKVDSEAAELDAEIARSTAKDTEHDEAIADEITRATDAETVLTNKIGSAFTDSANENITFKFEELSAKTDSEIARATSKDSALESAIAAETTRATGIESGLRSDVNDLQTALAQEAERRASGDSVIREDVTRIDNRLESEIVRATTKENELNASITAETLRAQAADNELYDKIADEKVDRTNADAALSVAISGETSRALAAETTISEALASETNNRINADTNLSNALTAETLARQTKDAELEQMIIDATLTFDDTTSIDFTKTTDNVVTADVKLQEGDNIIKLGQGLYATAHLSYDTGTNKIKLTTTAGEEEYQLAGATVIDNLEYDSTNKELVITYHDGNGGVHTVRFGVSELFNEWSVQNPSENSAIELTKTPAATPGGEDKLSGRVLLTNLDDNAIQIVNNGLYVPAGDMEEAKEIAECAKNELNVLEKVVIGHQIGEECGSGYTYEPNNTSTYISAATSFNNADVMLDQSLKRVEDKLVEVSGDTDCIDAKANKIYELLYGAGTTMPECGEGAHYQPYVDACIISAATSFNEADQMLNDQICEILTMWTSGQTCTSNSDWVEDGANRRIEIDVRLSRGKYAGMSDEDIFIEKLESPLEYIDPTNNEFTDTNVLRIACINEGPSGTTPSVASMQNGIYLSNEWDCGLYYGPSDTEAKEKAEAAGYITDPYSTDETSGASNYNYNNNVRQTPTP